MRSFCGIPASEGIVIAKALVYAEKTKPEIPQYGITEAQIPSEWERLQKALAKAAGEVKELHEQVNKEQAGIFEAHLLMLEDADFHDQIKDRLHSDLHNIERAVMEVAAELSGKLQDSPDPVFRERAADINDVSRRTIDCLLGVEHGISSLAALDEDVIVVARELMPSDMLAMDKSRVKGIATDQGSSTCHAAILARSFNIPAVMGLSDFFTKVTGGELLALNGSSGNIVINPDKHTLAQYKTEEKQQHKNSKQRAALRELPAQTTDGHRIILKANIGFPEEAENLRQYGAEGIGLYRSEFLFTDIQSMEDEEAQYHAYSRVLRTMGKLPVTIRTMDAGGDKVQPGIIVEKNPLLGLRAIRVSLGSPGLFKVQLRALLRASVHGTLRIMFPLISGIEELDRALTLLDEARCECTAKGQPFDTAITAGVMIEVPSAAITADILAEKSDFFSIGTNDLIQYSLAADRGNEKVSYLGEALHPAVLRLIKQSIDAAHAQGITACLCGEVAGDPEMTGILIGMGLDELSMIASSVPRIKEIIRKTSLHSAQALAAAALSKRSIAGVRETVQAWMAEHGI